MNKSIRILSLALLLLTMLTNVSCADTAVQSPESVRVASSSGYLGISQPHIEEGLVGSLGGIISVVQIVGTAVAVGASIYLGIRYILSSVEEKADIKKKMVPFIVGVVIFYGATGILQLISAVAKWF